MLDELLRRYPINRSRPTSNGLIGACPFHKNGQEKKLSFSMNEEGLWTCFSGCGSGNLAQFIHKYAKVPMGKAVMLAEELTMAEAFSESLNNKGFVDRKAAEEQEQEENEERFRQQFKFYKLFKHDYLLNLGFTTETLEAFRIGYDPDNDRVVFPIFDKDDKLRGFQYRGTKEKIYTTEFGFKKNNWLFGEHLHNKRHGMPWLVEGPTDAMWLYQKGFLAFSCMGVKFSERQADRLCALGYDKILLAFDNDDAGREAVGRAKLILGRRVDVYLMDYSNMAQKDWKGMSKKDLLYFSSTAKLARR